MSTLCKTVRRRLAAFCGARGGNVALMFAVAAVPIIVSVGFAVDYSRANSAKTAMQDALDATALMLSKQAPTLSNDQLQTLAQSYFNSLFARPGVSNIVIAASYSTAGGSSVTVNGSAEVPTSFLSVLGYKDLAVDTSSTVRWGSSRLRVALVLDNTGSMNDNGKIGALKTATKNLLSQLQSAVTTPGDVYVSIVPFVKDVSVDPSGYNTSWDNWIQWDDGTDNSWDGANGSCSISGYSPRSKCVAQYSCSVSQFKTQSSCASAGTCSNSNYSTQNSCLNAKAKWMAATWQAATWTPKAHSTWNGCLTDRGTSSAPGTSAGYDQNVTAPTPSIPATLFPAEQYSACPEAMMGLNYDWTTMNSMVNSMVANGNTNQPIGLVWGWQTLVGGGPFTAPAMDPNYQYQQIIILLSDGLNTQDRWYTNQSSIDNRMYSATTGNGTCANIKAAGVTIYTIQVDTGGDPTSTLLENCASNTQGTTDHFFLLTSASQIVTTFQAIGTNLTKLRIAK
jgi:Flp pilus assembly protein TadG